MADEEVKMVDAPPLEAPEAESSKPVQSIETDPKEEDDGEDEGDQNAGSDADDADNSGRAVSADLYKALKNITDVLINHKIKVKHRRTEEDHYPSILFRRLPNKRNLPDYYEIIKEPSAISTLKGKIQRKQYTGVPEFVRDFALIVHNAQIYNRPNSGPVRDVLRIDALFKEEMQKLVEDGIIPAEQTEFPDLGEIPYATPEPDPVEEEEDDGDEEDEDDDDDGDDSDDDRRKKRNRRGRVSISGKKQDRDDEDDNENENDKANDAEQKRRGRPPKVDTPMEARIKAILKGLRKFRNSKGQIVIFDFEKLPDKAEHPAYYVAIQNPVALDLIKKKAKRKKYNLLEDFMQDIEIMFNNAMLYNEDGSEIHDSAKELLEEAKKLAQVEMDKPDSEYLMQDGRLPLPFIEYNGKMWRIGDWIHIQNPNDVTKPIVAQIYRTWQDPDERKWINACWYYRPEQTVHQYEKHFYPKEVVKTGQYRDHPIEEVIDKCFVMFFTRYGKGRPRGIDPSTEVYVCDSRYNEEKFKFNKIKTWASCLPDEVRDKDYEMDLYDVPKRVKKIPSPLLHTLQDDTKESDEIPQPTWAHPNAPPVLGAVHKRPREENQSPPPEPTPPPPPTPPPVVRVSSSQVIPQQPRPSLDRNASSTSMMGSQIVRPSPSMTPQTPGVQPVSATPITQHSRQNYTQNTSHNSYVAGQSQAPVAHQSVGYSGQPMHTNLNAGAAHPNNYNSMTPAPQSYPRQTIQSYQAQQAALQQQQQQQQQQYAHAMATNADQGLRQKEVFTLPDNANEAIPKEIRDRLPQDERGRVLFFTQPPIHSRRIVEGRTESERGRPLMHTERYMRFKKMKGDLLAKRKRETEDQGHVRLTPVHINGDGDLSFGVGSLVKPSTLSRKNTTSKDDDKVTAQSLLDTMLAFNKHMEQGLFDFYKVKYGDNWKATMLADLEHQEVGSEAAARQGGIERSVGGGHADEHGLRRQALHQQSKMMHDKGFAKDFWTGLYLDDIDPRLPPFN